MDNKKTNQTMIVDTKQGKIRGTVASGVAVFKGVPYAKPPIGNLRFTPPQKMEPWDDVKDCLEFGSSATQMETILVNTKPSEDCLYLNIWAPEKSEGKKYPVFFWIHGGGYFNGCGTMNYYDGTEFVNKDVILVTINYRLGAMGFLALETLMKQYGTTGNWGTLDQIAALTWVKENIAAFGGDPEQITIGGESAGSFSVTNLVMSPKAKGLFKRAVMQSGNLLSNKVSMPYTQANLEASIEASRKFAEKFGADDSPEGLEKLRQCDAYQLWETGFFSSDVTVSAPLAFWPTLDGAVLPKNPEEALKQGEYNKAEYLMGFNQNEGMVFLSETSTPEGAEWFIDQVFKEKAQEVKDYYKNQGLEGLALIPDLVTYSYFKAGTIKMMQELANQGNTVYGYQFDFMPDGNYPMKELGAHHAVDILYTFDTIPASGLTEGEYDGFVAEQMHTMWCNFIANGNPNKGFSLPDSTPWDKFEADRKMMYYFNQKMESAPLKDEEKISYFQQLLYK
ncbi:MAG: carboxylesterase family protein [Oscillospiraceae bacterium]|nr:carboxylesterase family protein [Oscillospiraceae bacterium]